ncbi:MAG: hypothetical protein GKS01_06540 [Alphaproteobacteria bacterium]|nr:hypothetical protein [Alphaproteobacteria bacterium]
MRARLSGTNINEKTLLATDYLNHFNELVMVLDLIPDMPDCLEDARAWLPKSYEEHFADSQFSDASLAIEAYGVAPPEYKVPFETTVERLNRYIPRFLDRIEDAIKSGDTEFLTHETSTASQTLQKLMDVVSALINGERPTMDQESVDALLEI